MAMSTVGAGVFMVFLLGSLLSSHASRRESHCTHNVASQDLVHHVYLEPEHHVKQRPCDNQFRVSVHYDHSVETGLPGSVKTRLKNKIIPRLTSFLESTLKVRPTGAPIRLYRDCSGGSFYPTSEPLKQCAFACQSVTICGTVEVPQDHLKACTQCRGSSLSCQTTGSDGPGVTNTDFVLYVSSKTVQSCSSVGPVGGSTSTVAFAGACQMENALNRPVAGYINFCPHVIGDSGVSDDFICPVAEHEILHALAFSWSLFPYWRDENGEPRTPRDQYGNPQYQDENGQYVPGESTVKKVTYTDWMTRSGPVSHTVYQIVTPKVVAEARHHFNCPTLEGLELENQGGEGTALSHWEKRILADEVMSGIVPAHPVLSRMTLALLEDSGWYTVDYSMGQPLVWGRNSGCALPTGSCGGYIQSKVDQGQLPSPYCRRLDNSSPQKYSCSVDRKSVAKCNLGLFTSSLPREYQYFDSGENFDIHDTKVSAIGGDIQIADFCPYQRGFSNKDCTQPHSPGSGLQNLYGEYYGRDARCIDQAGPWNATQGLRVTYSDSYGSGCYQVRCSKGKVTLYVFDQAFDCSAAGEEIQVDVTEENIRYRGSLICPACEDICYEDTKNCPRAASIYGKSKRASTYMYSSSGSDKSGSEDSEWMQCAARGDCL